MSNADSLTSADAIRAIEQACNSFEKALQNEPSPRIEEYLAKVSEPLRDRLLRELLTLEIVAFRERGECPLRSSYHGRFTRQVKVIDEAFRATLYMSHIVPLTTGEVVDGYVVDEQISSGGFGVVFRATHSETNEQVAIKCPQAEAFRDQDDVARFEQEIASLKRLKHKRIVTVLREGVTDAGTPYLVMQLLDGKTLVDWVQTERPTLRVKMRVLEQIARAIAYVHRQGFVHRDLSTKNIVVLPNDTPVITDFGLAVQDEAQQAHRGEQAGSWAFMSPEQVRGESHHIDGRTDIWALGVIFYFLLTGKRPFNSTRHEALTEEILHRAPKPPRQHLSAIPKQLEQACNCCLEKRITDRYATADDLAEDITPWVHQETRSTRVAAVICAACIVSVAIYGVWKLLPNAGVAPPPPVVPTQPTVNRYLPIADTVATAKPGAAPRIGKSKAITIGTPSHGEENAMVMRFPWPEVRRLDAVFLRFVPFWCSDESMAGEIRLVKDDGWEEGKRVKLSMTQNFEASIPFVFDGPRPTRIDISKLFANLHELPSGTVCLSIHVSGVEPNLAAQVGSRENVPRHRPALEIESYAEEVGQIDTDDYFVAAGRLLSIDPLSGVLINDKDASHNWLEVKLAKRPQTGTLTLHPDGSFLYEPFPNHIGTEEFHYRVTDDASDNDLQESKIGVVRLTIGESKDVLELPSQVAQLNEGRGATDKPDLSILRVGHDDRTNGRSCALIAFDLRKTKSQLASAVLRLNCANASKPQIKQTLKVLWNAPWNESPPSWDNIPFQFAEYVVDIEFNDTEQIELDVSAVVRECLREAPEDRVITFVIETNDYSNTVHYVGETTGELAGPTLVLTTPK